MSSKFCKCPSSSSRQREMIALLLKGDNGALQTKNRVDYSLNYSTQALKLVDIIVITETDEIRDKVALYIRGFNRSKLRHLLGSNYQ